MNDEATGAVSSIATPVRQPAVSRVEFLVVNTYSGSPISGFRLSSADGNDDESLAHTRLGGDGRFEVTPGMVRRFLVKSDGFSTALVRIDDLATMTKAANGVYLVELTPSGLISGVAKFADGLPAAGATVIGCSEPHDPWQCVAREGQPCNGTASVDPDGSFALQVAAETASTAIMVVGGGAYLASEIVSNVDLGGVRLEIECARARAVTVSLAWPEGRIPFPDDGFGFPYRTVVRNIDIWGRQPLEVPDVFARYYTSAGASTLQRSPFEFTTVVAQPVAPYDDCEVRVEVRLPGYQPIDFRSPIDLHLLEPLSIPLGLTNVGPEPGIVNFSFDLDEAVPVPTGRGYDIWVKMVDEEEGAAYDTAIQLERAPQACRIAGVPAGKYKLLWRPADFAGPYLPLIREEYVLEVGAGSESSVHVSRDALTWWIFHGEDIESGFDPQVVRLYASLTTNLNDRESYRGESSRVFLGGGRTFPIALQPNRSYRASFRGNPFYAADGSVIPVSSESNANDRFVSRVLGPGEVEHLWLRSFSD